MSRTWSHSLIVVFLAANWLTLLRDVDCDIATPAPAETSVLPSGEQHPQHSLANERDHPHKSELPMSSSGGHNHHLAPVSFQDHRYLEATDKDACGVHAGDENLFAARSAAQFSGIHSHPASLQETLQDRTPAF